MSFVINYVKSFFWPEQIQVFNSAFPNPNQSLETYTKQLQPYLELIQNYPHLFPSGDPKKGEMALVTDPKLIQEIARKHGGVGIAADNGFAKTVMVARQFPFNPKEPEKPIYGTYVTTIWNKRLKGAVGVATLVMNQADQIAINIIHRNAQGWVGEIPRGILKKAESLGNDDDALQNGIKECAAREVLEETGIIADPKKAKIIGNYIPESGFNTDVVPIVYIRADLQTKTSREGAEHGMETIWMTKDEINLALMNGYLIHNGKFCAFADGFLQTALNCYERYRSAKKTANPRISYLTDRAQLVA